MKQITSRRLTAYIALCLGLFVSGTVAGQTQFVSTSTNHDAHRHSATVDFEPVWDLVDWRGQHVSSNEYVGKPHLIIMHLGGDCLHCVEQLAAFSPTVDEFNRQGIAVMTISPEDSGTLARSILEFDGELPFNRMLCDEHSTLFNQLRAFDNFSNEPLHGTFLIDAAGRIRWQHTGHHPFMDADRLLQIATTITQQEEDGPEPPRIFLDRSPRAVAYQLGRLDNERLLLVERKPDDPRYAPVYSAILSRGGMSPAFRQESLAALVSLNESSAARELLTAISTLKDNRQDEQTAGELARMLLRLPAADLQSQTGALMEATSAPGTIVRSSAYAALIVADRADEAWAAAAASETGVLSCLEAVRRIPDASLKSAQRERVLSYFEAGQPDSYRIEAIRSLRSIPEKQDETFDIVADTVTDESLRTPAVRTLLNVPSEQRNESTSRKLVSFLVTLAEETPAENRTTTEFIDAMQLADQLLALIPVDDARSFRDRLNEVTVRVVRIRTIEDEMRYDTPWFAVEAGRPVQVVLQNDDLAAHNLIITRPGELQLIADIGLKAGPNNGYQGKQYVPDHPSVMWSTDMLQTDQSEALTFNAPEEPGEYPYVCTFPQHWSRMYGVMVVVEDLDAWLKNPVEPKDPTGNARSLVQNWTMDDLQEGIQAGIEGRSMDIGKKIFVEATCAQCHRLGGEGGAVGPELDEVFAKFEDNPVEVLRELLEPSHRIDEKYSMHKVLTLDGLVVTGIIVSQDDEKVELIDNPESTEPTVILLDDIEDMVKTSKSIMPKGLLDNFTQDEIYEMFYYLQQSQVDPLP